MERQNLMEDLFAYFEIDKGRYYKSEETWKDFYKKELLNAFKYGAYWESKGMMKYKHDNIEEVFEKFFDLFHNTKLNQEDETED